MQAVTQLSIEVWSYNANHWEPILEPVGLLVHLHHNTRSKMVKKYRYADVLELFHGSRCRASLTADVSVWRWCRPGTHLSFKITSDTLHITVAHNALDSLLRAMGDASAMMKGDSSGVLQTARQSARCCSLASASASRGGAGN